MKKSKITLTKLDELLAKIALYEQAKAHLIGQGKPVTDFIQSRLPLMYDEITPFINYFVAKEFSK